MSARRSIVFLGIAGLLAGTVCAAAVAPAETSNAPKSHKKAAKKPQLPPLPSGPQGPVPQIALDSMQAVAPHVTYEGGQLTIVAPNSTLADILRAVRKLTGAEMDIPAAASERVVTNLGPGPASGVVAELLNGSHFNYVLLGSPSNANTLTRVVLVPKGAPETATPTGAAVAGAAVAGTISPQPVAIQNAPDTPDAESADDSADENADQNAADAEQPQAQPGQGDAGVKTPQQLLQEMQQRQLQMQQQQQQQGQPAGQPPIPGGYPPGQRPIQPPPQPPDQE